MCKQIPVGTCPQVKHDVEELEKLLRQFHHKRKAIPHHKGAGHMTIIDAVFSTILRHRDNGFKLNTLRKAVVKQVGVVSNSSITRALRKLRAAGWVSYEYDTHKGLYKF